MPNTKTQPDFRFLRFDEKGPVARITLNRPEARNALSIALSAELYDAILLVQESTTIKALVIDGAGETFCAGDDLVEFAQLLDGSAHDLNDAMRTARRYQATANALEELDKITIAAVDGYAVGGGLEITMACDFVIATERARWGMPEIDIGITPGWGGTTRMSRLIGRRLTKEINMLGALQPAVRARELGLWNRIVPDGELEAEVGAFLEVLLSKNQQMLRQLKFIINRGVEADLYTAQGFEALSVGITSAVNGKWRAADADEGDGLRDFATKGRLWHLRRDLARNFWADA